MSGHGSGSGALIKGKLVESLDEVRETLILIAETDNFDGCTNVLRVLDVKHGPSNGFNAIFVNPANVFQLRMAGDQQFFVWWPPSEHDRYYFVENL